MQKAPHPRRALAKPLERFYPIPKLCGTKQPHRRIKGMALDNSLLRDVKYGVRSLLRDKGFSLTVLVTLAVCIAANTATFAVVHSVLLKPLPVPEARRILI